MSPLSPAVQNIKKNEREDEMPLTDAIERGPLREFLDEALPRLGELADDLRTATANKDLLLQPGTDGALIGTAFDYSVRSSVSGFRARSSVAFKGFITLFKSLQARPEAQRRSGQLDRIVFQRIDDLLARNSD